jgi:1-acyl-sn-glycerol-3-phosphate acyltransferase
MRDPQGEPVSWFYHFSVGCTTLLLNVFSRWRVIGRERVPLRGPLLVVCNHQNNADPAILVAVMPRVIHQLAKQELFWGPIGWMGRGIGAFPIRRGQSDRQAIKTALDYLERGSCVGIFPEGTRSRTGGLTAGQTGAGLLAVRSGARVLPVAIVGSGQLRNPAGVFSRPAIDIIFGEPFEIGSHEGKGRTAAAAAATEQIMIRIGALLPPGQRGVYAEQIAGCMVRGE